MKRVVPDTGLAGMELPLSSSALVACFIMKIRTAATGLKWFPDAKNTVSDYKLFRLWCQKNFTRVLPFES